MEKIKIINLEIQNYTFDSLLEELKEGVVFTANVDHLIKLQKDEEFYRIYNQVDYIVCDSRIIQKTSGWVSPIKIKEQIAGSDLFPAYCHYHKDHTDEVKVFLLGGRTHETMAAAWTNLNQKVGAEIVIDGYSPPFGFEKDEQECQAILDRINDSGATVVAVGVGCPKQEKWIMKYKHLLPGVKIFFAIGATIDFQAGTQKRSPQWMSRAGLEWLHRMAMDPGRMIKRYLIDDMPYFYLLFLQKIGRYQDPWTQQPLEVQGS